ncbi:hypothetical protein ONZ45_g14464 [Pleurotus djamor]|nr:hypothetical protein ONZ45_g14464 [Pleurotus djamor]
MPSILSTPKVFRPPTTSDHNAEMLSLSLVTQQGGTASLKVFKESDYLDDMERVQAPSYHTSAPSLACLYLSASLALRLVPSICDSSAMTSDSLAIFSEIAHCISPLIVGTMLTCPLYGIMLAQSIWYFTSCESDSVTIRVVVAFVLFVLSLNVTLSPSVHTSP